MMVSDYVVVEADEEFKRLLGIIFTDNFMRKNTRFNNFEAFKYSSAVMTNWNSDQMIYSQSVFNNFVKESTDFNTWEEMVKKATDERFSLQYVKEN